MPSTPANTSSYETDPTDEIMIISATASPMSPTRLTTNALRAAEAADGRVDQNPINRYDARPTPSHPTYRPRKLSAMTSSSIAATNRLRYAKNRRRAGSSRMYPIEYTWMRVPTPVMSRTKHTDSWSRRRPNSICSDSTGT